MSLYNHAAIWKDFPEKWPRGIFCNGWIMVDGEKMAKSLGNFITISDAVDRFGADATRIALADSGDSLDDANFVTKEADNAILNLYALYQFINTTLSGISSLRESPVDETTKVFDEAFEQQMMHLIYEVDKSYESMRFRDALHESLYLFANAREDYRVFCGTQGFNRKIILDYIKYQLLILYPLAPHICEYLWIKEFQPIAKTYMPDLPTYLHQEKFPTVEFANLDVGKCKIVPYVKVSLRSIRLALDKAAKAKNFKHPTGIICVVAKEYRQNQQDVLKLFKTLEFNKDTKMPVADWKNMLKDSIKDKKEMVDSLQFGAMVLDNFKVDGEAALALDSLFDEEKVMKVCAEAIKKEFKVENVDVSANQLVFAYWESLLGLGH